MWRKYLLLWGVCTEQASQSEAQRFHLLYSINIKGIALHLFSADQFSVKTALCWRRSTELKPKNLPLPGYAVDILHWETGLRNYLYSFSSKAFCKDDLITSCIVIWKWKNPVMFGTRKFYSLLKENSSSLDHGVFCAGHGLWLGFCVVVTDSTFPTLV